MLIAQQKLKMTNKERQKYFADNEINVMNGYYRERCGLPPMSEKEEMEIRKKYEINWKDDLMFYSFFGLILLGLLSIIGIL